MYVGRYEGICGWMGGWVDGWMGGSVDRWIGGWVDGWMVDGWLAGWVDGWMGGRVDGVMGRWVVGWCDGCMYKFHDKVYCIFYFEFFLNASLFLGDCDLILN